MNRPTAVAPYALFQNARDRISSRVGAWGLSVVLFGLIVGLGCRAVGDFSRPLSDGNDTDQYEYVGYYFGKNLRLWPVPQLDLTNTQTFYPYGTNQVFLDWGFERDYWYALCYKAFGGAGPYLQFYYVYSLLVAGLGTFWLLRSRFGLAKPFLLSLLVSVFNIYALWKFPVHMNVCVLHWTTLCIVATYRLLIDVLDKRPISVPYVLGWMVLHVLVLSQELAYVAGFALTFTTLAAPVLAYGLFRNWQRDGHMGIQWPTTYRERLKTVGMGLLLLVGLWLYLPLTLQIALTAWQFDFTTVPTLRAWSHPARLLIPHLPGLNAFALDYVARFHDTFESYGQGSPGLAVVVLAGLGAWSIRRRAGLWLPVVLMLVLCLFYHPVLLPTLKVFPWFSFNRHGGRASMVYPVLLGLLALWVRWPRRVPGQVVGVLVLGLLGAEWYTSYTLRLLAPVNLASDSVLRYCERVRRQPGVAVLDWPFCTVGADGVGAKEGLCPYYDQQNAVFTFRRFYDKSAVGQYFGRLHPDQIQPFLRDGWPRLLTPGRAFTPADWQFFDQFLRQNQFAGINLYPDLLSPAQVAEFYRRYGSPVAETRFPAAGRVVFLALPPSPGK